MVRCGLVLLGFGHLILDGRDLGDSRGHLEVVLERFREITWFLSVDAGLCNAQSRGRAVYRSTLPIDRL